MTAMQLSTYGVEELNFQDVRSINGGSWGIISDIVKVLLWMEKTQRETLSKMDSQDAYLAAAQCLA